MCSTFVTRRVTNVVRSKAVDAANRLIGAPKLGRNSTIERAQQRGAFDRRAAGGHRRNGEVVCLSLWFMSACGSDNRIEPVDPLGTMIQSLFSSSTTGSTTVAVEGAVGAAGALSCPNGNVHLQQAPPRRTRRQRCGQGFGPALTGYDFRARREYAVA